MSIDQKDGRKEFMAILGIRTSALLASQKAMKYWMKNATDKMTNWTTPGGLFETSTKETVMDMVLSQFTRSRKGHFDMKLLINSKDST